MIGDLILAAVVGIAASLVASIAFLVFLTKMRPRIMISEKVVRSRNADGSTDYRIKIVNLTRYPINKVKAEVAVVQYRNAPGGKYKARKPITLMRSDIMQLLPRSANAREEHADYAFRFRTTDDIDSMWDDSGSDFLRIAVYAEHSVSGFSHVAYRTYHSKESDLVTGSFKYGPTTEVVLATQERVLERADDTRVRLVTI